MRKNTIQSGKIYEAVLFISITIQILLQLMVNLDLQHDGLPYYIGKIVAEGNIPHQDFKYIWGPFSAWFYSVPFALFPLKSLLMQRCFFLLCEILICTLNYRLLVPHYSRKKALIISGVLFALNPTAMFSLDSQSFHPSHAFWPNRICTLFILLVIVLLERIRSRSISLQILALLTVTLPLIRFNFLVFSFITIILVLRIRIRENEKHKSSLSIWNVQRVLYLFSILFYCYLLSLFDWFRPFLEDSTEPFRNPTYENGAPGISFLGIFKSLMVLFLIYCSFMMLVYLKTNVQVHAIRVAFLAATLIGVSFTAIRYTYLFGLNISHYFFVIVHFIPLGFIVMCLGYSFILLPRLLRNASLVDLVLISGILSMLPLSHNLNLDYIWLNSTVPMIAVFRNLPSFILEKNGIWKRALNLSVILISLSACWALILFGTSVKTTFRSEYLGGVVSTDIGKVQLTDDLQRNLRYFLVRYPPLTSKVELTCRNALAVALLDSPPVMNIFRGVSDGIQAIKESKTMGIFCEVNSGELEEISKSFGAKNLTWSPLEGKSDSFFVVVTKRNTT